eukprot:INCI16405.2.p1 GENE.INCI16405.2~~INCI16405.2.p1  ORF type:complete len:393 (+),score=41.55 INCI16405.2:102-1181(+)
MEADEAPSGVPSKAVARQIMGLLHDDVQLTDELVRRAFRKLALRLHPDKNPHPQAKAQFQRLTAAKLVLLSDDAAETTEVPMAARRPAAANQHACPRCDEDVFPPNDPTDKLFRCPVCKHILRNPFYDRSAATAAANTSPDAGSRAVSQVAVLKVGSRVVAKGRYSDGVVRFIGTTEFSAGEWIGVELDSPLGKHDGAVRGQRYFTCRPKHGVFLKRDQLHLKAVLAKAVEALASDALRVFEGALDPRTCDESSSSVVWRCRSCDPQSHSVCCRVSERRGVCICGHKIANHRDKRGKEPSGRPAFACVGKCPCRRFRYHIQQGGWAARCSCKHKHTDHDPVTEKCSKMIPGRKPCPCTG